MRIIPFEPRFEDAVLELVVGIQRGEFDIDITAEQQPDLRRIPTTYQTGAGNFWVALDGDRVVGTASLLDIGNAQVALRKMFVHSEHRGVSMGTAQALLETLLAWARERRVGEIFLGTTPSFRAAHRFYEKNGFCELPKSQLPPGFPVMEVDTKFYRLALQSPR